MTEHDQLMTPQAVAVALRVDPRTVARWARTGLLHPVFTLGGHRRHRASEVLCLLEEAGPPSFHV